MRSMLPRTLCAFLLAMLPIQGEPKPAKASTLAEALLRMEPPDSVWSPTLNARILAGEPLPQLSPPKEVSPTSLSPAELLAYWRDDWPWRNGKRPDNASRQAILKAVRSEPSAIHQVLRALPSSRAAAEEIASLSEKLPCDTPADRERAREIRAWIYQHSGLLRDEVLADAPNADWERYKWNERPDPTLDALLTREPAEADRLLEEFTHADNPGLAVVAARLLMERAAPDQKAKWRQLLIDAVADPDLPEDAGHIAVNALIRTEWPGRNAWILSCIKTISPGKYWFHLAISDDPEFWIPELTQLIGSTNRIAHNHAAALLSRSYQADALRPLIPWLRDPAWAEGNYGSRIQLIQRVAPAGLYESCDALLHLLQTEDDDDMLGYAAVALADFKIKAAVPLLKSAITRCKSADERCEIASSLILLNGLTNDEMADGLAAFYRLFPKAMNRPRSYISSSEKGFTPEVCIGRSLSRLLPRHPNESLLNIIGARANDLISTEAALATNLYQLIARCPSDKTSSILAQLLIDGKFPAKALKIAIFRCHRETWYAAPFQQLLDQAGQTGGYAAILGRSPQSMASILEGSDREAQAALLAAARLSKDPLPFALVAPLLESDRKTLAKAASFYLQERDEPEALRLWKQSSTGKKPRPGGFDSLMPRLSTYPDLPGRPSEIYSLRLLIQGGTRSMWFVLVYPNQTLALRDFDSGRWGSAPLTKFQLDKFRKHIATYRADTLPDLELPICDGAEYIYLRATPSESSFVYMDNPPRSALGVDFWNDDNFSMGIVHYGALVNLFTELFDTLDLKLSYPSGIRILVPSEKARVLDVWKHGKDLRVLVANSYEVEHWEQIDPVTGKLLGPASKPEDYQTADQRKGQFLDSHQPTGRPDEVWAADPTYTWKDGEHATTSVGRFDTKNSKFSPLNTITGITFRSGAMWVDEDGGLIYAAVNDDLISVPLLPKNP